ncbi:MAG: hypothetical protein ACKOQ1_10105, partial [Actinomycetota bacterium]
MRSSSGGNVVDVVVGAAVVAGNAAAPTFPVASLDLVTGQWTLHQQPTAVWNFAGDQRTTILASET